MVALINPPIMTIAKGFCVSEPIPVERAAGVKPIEAIIAVIKTGRVQAFMPSLIASCKGFLF